MVDYIGLDVSLKNTSICVVNQAGSIVREGIVDSDPEAIAAFVRSKAPGAVRVGLEKIRPASGCAGLHYFLPM
jgi:transposase